MLLLVLVLFAAEVINAADEFILASLLLSSDLKSFSIVILISNLIIDHLCYLIF